MLFGLVMVLHLVSVFTLCVDISAGCGFLAGVLLVGGSLAMVGSGVAVVVGICCWSFSAGGASDSSML